MELRDQSRVFKQRYRALPFSKFNTWLSNQFAQSFRHLGIQTGVQHAKNPDHDLERAWRIYLSSWADRMHYLIIKSSLSQLSSCLW